MFDCMIEKMAYNKYSTIRNAGYLILQHLMLENEDLWKILKYDTANALSLPNLTMKEKRELIYNGIGDSENYRIFRGAFIDDAVTAQQTQLRVYVATLNPENRSVGTVTMAFECVTHNKLVNLDSYESRLEVMVQEILRTLNGADVNSLGTLVFDYNSSNFDMASINIYNNRNFFGFTLLMSCKVGDINEV